MPNHEDGVRGSAATLDLPNLLKQSTHTLLGVTQAAADALAQVGIRTVFDLGASNLFASAREVVAASRAGTPANRFGIVASDLLTDDAALTPLDQLGDLPLSALRMLTAPQAAALAAALDVATIEDFANWPAQLSARRLIGEVAGGTMEPDDLQAEELRPRFGQYPTERVYYSTLTMLRVLGDPGPLVDIGGPISLKPAVDNPGGLSQPAVGALLTFEQSWFAQGVTLGHLLHSLALAPGEATRVAVIDWSRRTAATATEAISEAEQLDSATNHARALSEVQQSVAKDFQQGASSSSSWGSTTSHAEASSDSSGLLGSLGHSGSGSVTDQSAETSAGAESASWSLGTRSVLGTMTQNVNDRTEQHSTSVRNRRASAVREVSQEEHEQVSTRIVANYNHMHALTVQYYEVVQLYRVTAALHRADRCLFLPMALLDFSPPDGMAVVERFRAALMGAALNARVRSLLADDTTSVSITPTLPVKVGGRRPDLAGLIGSVAVRSPLIAMAAAHAAAAAVTTAAPASPASPTDTPPTQPAAPAAEPVARVRLWDDAQLALVSRLLGRPLVRPDSDALQVPDDTELLGVSFDGVTVRAVRLDGVASATGTSQTFTVPPDTGIADMPAGLRLVDLDAISVSKGVDLPGAGTMTLHCAYLGRRFTLPAIPIQLAMGTSFEKVVTFATDQADRRKELLAHLQGQRDYYSQAVFRSLDSATLTLVLGQFKWNGRPLIDQIEPRPITVAGNYLVLRAPVSDDEPSGVANADGQPLAWGALLESRGLPLGRPSDERLVPVATGGVFAEAVLGRSNSAEKLDLTRFWHWEDSPIPMLPTEIAPVSTGSRATAEDLTPGQLSAPVLNIVNPTSLPDPTGLGAAYGALANLNFRDMSGLAGTQGLVKAAEEGTISAATDAGKLASDNMRTEAQKAVQMAQVAADIAKTAIAAGTKGKAKDATSASAMAGISRDGAQINHGKKLDAAAAAPSNGAAADGAGASGSSGGGAAGGDSGGGGGGGGGTSWSSGGGGGGGRSGVSAPSHEVAAFDAAVYGTAGASGAAIMRDAFDLAEAADSGGGGGAGGGAASTATQIFPSPVASVLAPPQDQKLSAALQKAISDSASAFPGLPAPTTIPIVIVAFGSDDARPWAGQRPFEMDYTGSLAKVCAMYAAFALRDAVNRFLSAGSLPSGITSGADPQAAVFAAVSKAFDDTIATAVPLLGKLPRKFLVPTYGRIFTLMGDEPSLYVDFAPDFRDDMEQMVIHSITNAAGRTIQALGYGWINGALQAAGFFRPGTKPNGLWLAGDYLYASSPPDGYTAWPTVTIRSENDGLTKQNTTCIDLARLLVLIRDGRLVDEDTYRGNTDMADIMRQGAHAMQIFLTDGAASITERWNVTSGPLPFEVVHNKIGIGDLKPDVHGNVNFVHSELSHIVVAGSGRDFVVAWQNQPDTLAAHERIRRIVTDTITKFLEPS